MSTHPIPPSLTPTARQDLKAQAHALDPVVRIGDAGLTPPVLAEVERALASHGLIKVRVAGDDRDARLAIRDRIATELGAAAVQTIGKLLVFWRPVPEPEFRFADERPANRVVKRGATTRPPAWKSVDPRDRPRTTRLKTTKTAVKTAKKTASRGAIKAGFPAVVPPRTARVRKSGQRSTKKPFQNQ